MHGGKSPGAPKGNRNGWKHGYYSANGVARRRAIRALLTSAREVGGGANSFERLWTGYR
jgi:hypothetical protein